MTELTGSEFKAKYLKTKFYKLTNESEIHNGFHYMDGLNIDTQNFNPSEQCSKCGLYFTELNKIDTWISNRRENIKYVREVEILDDSLVYIEENEFKADKFYLHPKLSLELFKCAVQQNGIPLKYVKSQAEKICELAVQQNGISLNYVNDHNDEIC